MTGAFELFLALLVGHALCDYPLQGDFLARGKNHHNPLPGVPWQWCLASHAAIHAGAVAFITGSVGLGVFEYGAHCLIDLVKSEVSFRTYSPSTMARVPSLNVLFSIDQGLHIATKAVIVCVWVLM